MALLAQTYLSARHGCSAILCVVAAQLLVNGRAQMCTDDVLSQYADNGNLAWPMQLDVGVYWFGPGDQFVKAKPGQKHQKFYNPSAPTVIYFHGWTGEGQGWVMSCKRVTTKCPSDVCSAQTHLTPGLLLMDTWLARGWNVGFFYWDQLADEDCARDAEQKIWFDKDGDGLAWKSYDVASQTHKWVQLQDDTAKSLGTLAANKVKEAMGEYKGDEVRFVGHDIGAQLAVKCAAELHFRDHPASPQRIAMLEPLFTEHHLGLVRCGTVEGISTGEIKKQLAQVKTGEGLGSFAADATASVVERLWKKSKVVTEIYKSSLETQNERFSNPNVELTKLGTVVIYNPKWCGGQSSTVGSFLSTLGSNQQSSCYHNAMFPLYFLQLGLPPSPLNPQLGPYPASALNSALQACPTPSASCSANELREWVERQNLSNVAGAQKWTQAAGMETFNITDDTFQLDPSVSAADTVVEMDASILSVPSNKESGGFDVDAGGTKFHVPVDGTMILVVVSVCVIVCLFGLLCYCVTVILGNKLDDSEFESGFSSEGDEDFKYEGRKGEFSSFQTGRSVSDADSATPLKQGQQGV